MTPEQKASQKVRLHASSRGMRLFRNNSGVLFNQENVPIRFGLGNESKKLNKKFKSGDFIGVTPIVITQEMVGKVVGVFTNIEAKAEGFIKRENYHENSREYAQQRFNDLVLTHGGLAGFASNELDVDLLIENYFQGLTE